jgi:hypothetical protein
LRSLRRRTPSSYCGGPHVGRPDFSNQTFLRRTDVPIGTFAK